MRRSVEDFLPSLDESERCWVGRCFAGRKDEAIGGYHGIPAAADIYLADMGLVGNGSADIDSAGNGKVVENSPVEPGSDSADSIGFVPLLSSSLRLQTPVTGLWI